MSRCFPFPPPNYRKEEKILTESIKFIFALYTDRCFPLIRYTAIAQKPPVMMDIYDFLWPALLDIFDLNNGIDKNSGALKLQKEEASKEKRKEKKDKKEKRERSKDKNENSKDRERTHKKRKHNETNELCMKDGSHGVHKNTKDACKIAAVGKNELHTKDACKIAAVEKNELHTRDTCQVDEVKMTDLRTKDAFLKAAVKINEVRTNDQKAAVQMNEVHMKDAYRQKAAVEYVWKDAFQKAAVQMNGKDPHHQKATLKDVATEQLERSGLTEEHGLPCLTPEPCESSESTHNSFKNRKVDANAFGQQGGTIIRLKLPLQKHKDPKPTVVVSEEPCLLGRAVSEDPEPTAAQHEEPCFSGRVTEAPTELQLGESSKSSRRRRHKDKKFTDLIVNWNPAPFLVGDEDADDLGWLLGNSRQERASSEAKSCGVGSSGEDVTRGSAACCLQPRACYLPEFETYQLPYAIPF